VRVGLFFSSRRCLNLFFFETTKRKAEEKREGRQRATSFSQPWLHRTAEYSRCMTPSVHGCKTLEDFPTAPKTPRKYKTTPIDMKFESHHDHPPHRFFLTHRSATSSRVLITLDHNSWTSFWKTTSSSIQTSGVFIWNTHDT